jgi:phosphatidylserine/phosphatidylglycerophosphate/cardiolipin synthase-like enzyme
MRSNAQTYTPAGIFHHKYVIVDQDNAASDPLVLTGSHNWSAAANTNNDENTLIIHDQMIANQFFQEFSARWENDGNTNCLVTSVKPIVSSTISLAPNPANEKLQVTLPRSAGRIIRVLTIDGKVVLSKKASADETTINIQALAPGAYLLQVEGVAVPARFIKQ